TQNPTQSVHFPSMNCILHSPYKLIGSRYSPSLVLDVSPHSQNKHNNPFIAGIIPGPKETDRTTISHVLEPLIDDLVLLNNRILVKTPNFPNGS
ncbi:hypothetical protein VP01_9538g1, partial [Puccinia sorghi]